MFSFVELCVCGGCFQAIMYVCVLTTEEEMQRILFPFLTK